MYIPETPIEIKKIKVESVSFELENFAKDFYDKFNPVFSCMNKTKKYAYIIEYPYGFPIIEDAKMYFLKKDKNDEYTRKNKVQIINEFDEEENNDTLWEDFVKDCERNTDHPLSIVLSNCVEVYTEQESGAFTSSININKNYKFPLNQIEIGGLFGVWGTLDLVSNGLNSKLSTAEKQTDWQASAGKSCFQFLLPPPERGLSNKFYQTEFSKIFGEGNTNLTDALHFIINERIQNVTTKILVFPEHYFLTEEEDSKKLQDNKLILQNYLYSYGWMQFKKHRDLLWENKALMKTLEVQHNDYYFQFLNHLIEVLNNNDYVLTLVNKSDRILYETFLYLCCQFEKKIPILQKDKSQFLNLLEYSAPFFFHYSKISDSSWGIVPYYAPAINVIIPKEKKMGEFKSIGILLKNVPKTFSKLELPIKIKEAMIIESQSDFETAFYKKFLLANVGKSKDVNKSFKDLFGEDFKDINTKIFLRENKNTLLLNSSIVLKIDIE